MAIGMNVPLMRLPLTLEAAGRQPVEREQTALRDMTAAIRRGDEEAFTRFYDLYSLRLYKYLLVLGKGDEPVAREVLQIVVIKLARKMQVFDEEGRLWAWMSRLARNAFVDRCRSHRRDRHLVSLDDLTVELAGAEMKEDRLWHCMTEALDEFTAEETELLRAAYVDERPLQELADEAGQTYKAVESRLGRLRKKLKIMLLNRLRHEKHV